MKLFIMTLRFLTRIPLPVRDLGEIMPNEAFAKGIVYYPLIGLITGILLYILYCVSGFLFSGMVPFVLVVLGEILITGGFHLDGLADTCDAIYSARDRKRMLEIMRDSRLGTNGAIAVLFDVLLKASFLSIMDSRLLFAAILLYPAAAKMVTPVYFKGRYAREGEGLGNIYFGNVSNKRIFCTVLTGLLILLFFLRVWALIPAAVCLGAGFLFLKYMDAKIGGMTGDTLGAGAEVTEVLFLMTLYIEGRFLL